MIDRNKAVYTQHNNVIGTINVMFAIKASARTACRGCRGFLALRSLVSSIVVGATAAWPAQKQRFMNDSVGWHAACMHPYISLEVAALHQ